MPIGSMLSGPGTGDNRGGPAAPQGAMNPIPGVMSRSGPVMARFGNPPIFQGGGGPPGMPPGALPEQGGQAEGAAQSYLGEQVSEAIVKMLLQRSLQGSALPEALPGAGAATQAYQGDPGQVLPAAVDDIPHLVAPPVHVGGRLLPDGTPNPDWTGFNDKFRNAIQSSYNSVRAPGKARAYGRQ